jgi:hypothetical protein
LGPKVGGLRQRKSRPSAIVLHRTLFAGTSFLLKLKLKLTAFAIYDVRHCRAMDERFVVEAAITLVYN